MFSSYRVRLQVAFLALGLAGIGLTGWEASVGATAALRQATYDRLAAIRQTRCRQIERYFEDLGNHVLALSADESTVRAIEEYGRAWDTLLEAPNGVADDSRLRAFYRDVIAPSVALEPEGARNVQAWYPADPRTRLLQHLFLAANPHPAGAKDQLLSVPGVYGKVHARYHPTMHRYQQAFGFYDILLIDGQGTVLYTVFKEIDLGIGLEQAPYRETPLADVYRRASALQEPEEFVVRDYERYLPSHLAPAAFLAAPIWRGGVKIGVLAIQVSVAEVNRVMTAGGRWREEGLGESGQAYIVGPDGALRSDLRFYLEHPGRYFDQLIRAGTPAAVVNEIRRDGTAILRLRVAPEVIRWHPGSPGTQVGRDARGVKVLRSHARLNVPGLDWSLIAEIDEHEALAPVRALRNRILGIGTLIAVGLCVAAAGLARSVTRPLLALAEGARRWGSRDFGTRLEVQSNDEIGQLAAAFNRMAESLDRTTVSKGELEVLAGRLITAQEDERRRLARELHDDLSQRLAAIAIEAGSLDRLLHPGADRLKEGLDRIKQWAARMSGDIHGLSRRLHPAMLDDLGLVAAIESECRGFFERGGPPVEFESGDGANDVPRDAQLALYRIVQEALRNIEKHAAAETVRIRLERRDGALHLQIEDDGRGCDRTHPSWRPGLGLASMEERARLLGGHLTVSSQPGAGTKIHVRLPLAEPNEQTPSPAG